MEMDDKLKKTANFFKLSLLVYFGQIVKTCFIFCSSLKKSVNIFFSVL